VHWITRMIIARKLATWQKIHKTLSPRHFRINWLFSDNYKLSYLCYVSLGNPLQILDRTANLGFEVNGQHSSRWCPFRTLSSLKSKPIPGRRENRIFLLIRCCFSDNAMNEDSPIGFQVHYHKQFFVILISITSHKDIKQWIILFKSAMGCGILTWQNFGQNLISPSFPNDETAVLRTDKSKISYR